MDNQNVNRRDLLKLGAAVVGAGLVGGTGVRAEQDERPFLGPAPEQPFAAPPIPTVRIGFVGVGLQGSSHVRNLLRIPGVQLKAVCDIVPEKVERIQQRTVEAGQPKPTGYTRGETDFVRLCEQEDLDLVYTATPWEWHVPVLVAAMKNGKHGATEVPAALAVDDCWQMVEGAEKYGKHCIMMENCTYDRPEMMVFNMVRQGIFGDVLHGECGYLHDLREIKFENRNEGLWRRAHATKTNGNLYPTHGLGPIANCMDNNRGDRFDYIVSMSGPSRGLQLWAQEHFPEGAEQRRETFVLGDVNVSLIKTANGRTIYLAHNTNSPRPYSRIHMVQGTRGLFHGYPEPHLHRGPQPRGPVGGPGEVLRGVRAPAVEADRRLGEERRPRRHGLPGGLPPDQVPARGAADRHERLRRGVHQRRVRAELPLGRQPQRAHVVPRLHARPLEDVAEAGHRDGVAGLTPAVLGTGTRDTPPTSRRAE